MTARPFLFLLILALVGCVPVPESEDLPADPGPSTTDPAAPAAQEMDREAAIAALRDFRTAWDRGRLEEARAALERAALVASPLEDWITVFRAEIASETGAVRETDGLVSALPDDMRWEWGWRARKRARLEAGDTAAAAALAEETATRLESPGSRASAFQAAGAYRIALGDSAAARTDMRAAAEAAPGARAALTAAQWLAEQGPEDPEDHRRIGEVYLRHENLPRAASGLEAWIDADGGTAEARADASYRLGMRAFGAGEHDIAERHLARVAAGGAIEAERAARALLYSGRAQYRAGRQAEGVQTFRDVPDRFPRSDAAAHALFLLAGLSHEAGEIERAHQDYEAAVRTGTDTDEAAVAAMRLAGLAILDGEPRRALSTLERYAGGEISAGRSAAVRYWIGRLHLESGDTAAARSAFGRVREIDPVSYYSVRAGDRLGEEERLAIAAGAATAGGRAPGWIEEALFRSDVLREAGFERESGFEADRLRRQAEGDIPALYAVAEAAIASERHAEGILVGREIRRLGEPWNARLMRIVWPFPYREAIEHHAGRHGLDPFLVAGLIRQESMFNPEAVSPAGAIGLMQLMPATAAGLARGEGIAPVSEVHLREPELNIRLGTRFLSDLLQRYDGRTLDAFAAYNAGPTRMRRWSALPEYADPEIFAERIPFDETRNYVKVLQFNRELYRVLYGS